MISRIVGLDTASEIWSTLDWTYVATSKSRLLELRTEIQSLKKDGLTVDEYVLNVGIMAHYWNGGNTIGMVAILLKKVAHYWNGGYTIGIVAILLKWWL